MKIEVKNLAKNYGEGDTLVHAVKKCSFTISQGEHIAIVGPSGSGKTTLLNVMGGLDYPTEGEVIYDGDKLPFGNENKLASFRLKNIGRVFQAYNLIPELTAYENIILPALINSAKVDKEYIGAVVSLLEIDDRLRHYPSELSGGQQQRVAIARALTNKPSVMLCDEPTGNLDEKSTEAVMSLLKRTSNELKCTLVIVTHDNGIAEQMDRIITIKDGSVTEGRN